MNPRATFHPIKNAAQLFAPLRVLPNHENGGFDIWTRRDERPGTLGNFVLATTQDRAEADLFAAAPELLAALKEAREVLVVALAWPGSEQTRSKINVAIAKAEGSP